MADLVKQDQQEQTTCQTFVHEKVCVQAHVTITPHVVAGPSESFCKGEAFIGTCDGDVKEKCEFDVSQEICVQIPLTFSATGEAHETGIVCGPKDIGECAGEANCTHTVGFFKNHMGVTMDLLDMAGGSIVLGGLDENGNPLGATLIVDSTNISNVLNLTPPSPPAPDPVTQEELYKQYRQLYAQLLTAELNVLNGAGCQFALDAIAAANTFLEGPIGPGAPGFEAPLDEFNNGNGPDCPGSCDEDQ